MLLTRLKRIDWEEGLFGAPFFVPLIIAFCFGLWSLSNGQSVQAMVVDTHQIDGGGWECDVVVPRDIQPEGVVSLPCDTGHREGDLLDAYWVPLYGWDSANDLWIPTLLIGPFLIGGVVWIAVLGAALLVWGCVALAKAAGTAVADWRRAARTPRT